MTLPVVSLASLASKVVLVQHLDTRELPRHLHREMEQYKRLKGDFTFLSVDLQVSAKRTFQNAPPPTMGNDTLQIK